MPGPIALVGSGEYLPVMNAVDRQLLSGRPHRVVMLPTAAGQEGKERLDYWADLGTAHYRSLGVDSVVLRVLDHDDANDPSLAAEIGTAGLIYLSGGSPAYLSETLRDSLVWAAIREAWSKGAAVAGCSAGACALTAIAGGFRTPARPAGPGLSLIGHLAVIPHFDHFDRRSPDLASQVLGRTPAQLTLIGIDERTALVGGSERFTVLGEQSVWWLDRDAGRVGYGPGTTLLLRPNQRPVVAD